LLLAVTGLVVAAAAVARSAKSGTTPLLGSTSGVLVIDVSRSITDAEFVTIGRVLRRLSATEGRVGLVFFSDVPYELLPPQAPTSALRPLLHFFTRVHGRFPPNPWETVFRAGTKISSALQLAGTMLAANHVQHGSIVLVSDLQTFSSDLTQLTQTLVALRQSGVAVHAVSLYPSSDGRQLFSSIFGPSFLLPVPRATSTDARTAASRPPAALPVALLALGGLLLLALAANEHWGGRLALPRAGRA
jgi:hypothetical protein